MKRRWTVVVGLDGSCASRAAPAYPNAARDAAEVLLLDAIESTPGRCAVRLTSRAVEGDPAEVLLRYSAVADALILGRAGRRPGSIHDQCVRLGGCLVMVAVDQAMSWPGDMAVALQVAV